MDLYMDSNQYKCFYIYAPCTDFLGVSLILINPGLVPQPEPYFDLTPIRATHTKIISKKI
jgi:hypothetical protein